ncbi:hypothetical protein B0T16DRAFT_454845 [Cercophora newfieldiana]|uniref:Uncharacterized protein n=1 Tax=Cercophora newfieldiana TaxID=92897 RepID=A0AA39YJ73_9PEZI|nr:hypothetical protein B0T16DRAFT_454845 [Cercophora newfieldiana]
MRYLCLASPLAVFLGSALAFTPLERRQEQRSWTPAKETGRSEERIGWSPKPTDAPIPPPRYGQMDLLKRADFTLGTDTCGFVSGFSSAAVTCVRQSAYCTNDGAGNMDCCTGEYSLCTSSMFSSCLNYAASQRGECAGKGARTICCWAESPSCYTLIHSTTASPGKVFSILQCQAQGGLDTLLATPPNFSITSSSASSSSSSSTTGSSSATTTTPGGGTGGTNETTSSSSTPVGAIVGGVVGGIAAIGLVIFLIFWLLIRNRRKNSDVQPSGAAAAQPPTNSDMAQTPQAGFPSPGIYSQFPQQPQQGQYPPGGQASEFKPFPNTAALQQQQQQQHPQAMGGYPPQQQQPGYGPPSAGYGGYPGATPNSGYPQSGSTSPGFHNQGFAQQQQQYGQGAPYPGHPGQGANELPVHYPPGSEGHRVELG